MCSFCCRTYAPLIVVQVVAVPCCVPSAKDEIHSVFVCRLQARDPIPQLRNYILEQGLLSEAQIKDLEREVTEVVEDAVKFADESPKPVRCLRTMPLSPIT